MTTRILLILAILAAPAAAHQHTYTLPPTQPLQPLLPTYQQPLRIPDITVPPVPTYQPPQRRIDPRDYMRQFEVTPTQQQQWQRSDDALQRNRYRMCAKYNIHCANMLRSLGR